MFEQADWDVDVSSVLLRGILRQIPAIEGAQGDEEGCAKPQRKKRKRDASGVDDEDGEKNQLGDVLGRKKKRKVRRDQPRATTRDFSQKNLEEKVHVSGRKCAHVSEAVHAGEHEPSGVNKPEPVMKPLQREGASDLKPAGKRHASKAAELQAKMREKLGSARFRYVNEQLYTTTGSEALGMFEKDEQLFHVYHHGFATQVAKWPVNPLDCMVAWLRRK